MIVGGFLSRPQIVVIALACAVLDFTNLPKDETLVHLIFSSAGFVGTGLFISELLRNRRMMTRKHLGDLMKLRREAEEQMQTLVESSRILMAAVAHEVRNICSAMLVVHKNLSAVPELGNNEDFHALNTLIQSLEKVTALELRPSSVQSATPVDLTSVLDESHVLIDSAYRESEMEVCWHVPSTLPVVLADRHGLIQVFLNLAKNSQRAMRTASTKRLDVTVVEEGY